MMGMNASISHDAKLIEDLGGPARVAELLGYDKSAGGTQRVHNWCKRGIPPAVRLARPDLFPPPPANVPATGGTDAPATERVEAARGADRRQGERRDGERRSG